MPITRIAVMTRDEEARIESNPLLNPTASVSKSERLLYYLTWLGEYAYLLSLARQVLPSLAPFLLEPFDWKQVRGFAKLTRNVL